MIEKRTQGLKVTLFLKVYNARGKLIHCQPCHSIVKQFFQMICCHFVNSSQGSVLDTGNTSRTLYPNYTDTVSRTIYALMWNTQAAAADITYGIILGTGQTAVTYSDYVIETLITHGTGAGQLSYAAMGSTALSDITDGQHFTVTRVITNSSGGSITVNEVALYAKGRTSTSYTDNYHLFCIERTVLGTPITIAAEESYTFEYDISLTI